MSLLAWSVLVAIGAVAAQPPRDDAAEARRLNRVGIEHLEAKRYEPAVRAFRQARTLLPKDENLGRNLATACAYLGVEHMNGGRFAAAEAALGEALELDPDRVRIRYYLGVLDFKRGRYRESVRRLEAVAKASPQDAAVWETLGHACYRLDRMERTIEAWKKSIALDSKGKSALRGYLERARKEARYSGIDVTGRSRHFRVKADTSQPGIVRIASDVLRALEDGHARISADLGFYPQEVVTVVLYTKRTFQEVTGMHHWVGGTFDGARIRVAVRDYPVHRDAVRRMLVHELTHLVVLRLAAGSRVPAWINEGFARVEEGVTAAESARVIRELGGVASLYPLDRLERPFSRFRSATDARRAYAQCCSFTHFLVGLGTKRGIGRFIRRLREPPEGGVAEAFRQTFGLTLQEAVRRWKESLAG